MDWPEMRLQRTTERSASKAMASQPPMWPQQRPVLTLAVEAEEGQPAAGTRATEEEARGLEREVRGERLPHARTPGGADEADGDAVERNEDGDDALQQLRWEIGPCRLADDTTPLVLDTGAAALGGHQITSHALPSFLFPLSPPTTADGGWTVEELESNRWSGGIDSSR
jgi:hypothetical protein